MSRVARIAVHHFRHALERPVTTVMGPLAHRPAILVEVEAEDGARGWGEVWCNFPPDGDLHRARMAANVLPSALSGLDTRKPFETFDHVRARLHRLAIQAGEPGPVDQVAAAADIAVHDLAARREGVSLARHLGGEARDVPAYASGIAPDAFGAQMERMRGLGYARFKLRIGFGPGEGLDALDGAAASLGPGERLIADANQAWSVEEALERLPRLAAHDLAWLEEPVPADTPWEGWRRLADEAAMPLAGGENLRGHDRLRPGHLRWSAGRGAARHLQMGRAVGGLARRACGDRRRPRLLPAFPGRRDRPRRLRAPAGIRRRARAGWRSIRPRTRCWSISATIA